MAGALAVGEAGEESADLGSHPRPDVSGGGPLARRRGAWRGMRRDQRLDRTRPRGTSRDRKAALGSGGDGGEVKGGLGLARPGDAVLSRAAGRLVMPDTIAPEQGGSAQGRSTASWIRRHALAAAVVAAGLALGTDAGAAVCTAPPPVSSDETMTCNCDTTVGGPDNVWKCKNKAGGEWTCAPSSSSPGGYGCAQTKAPRSPGGGKGPGGSGGGGGGGTPGGSLPPKGDRPIAK